MYRRMNRIVLLIVVVLLGLQVEAHAKSGKPLMTINGIEYTNEDFKNWWKHWNDKGDLKFPTTPSDFVDFQLMVQQGKEMDYDSQPSYLHKLEVFLKVRAMMALKYEEVDSKISVTEADLRKYFDENYSTIWFLQILAFENESKAQKAYELMLPFKGQTAGRLIFADLYGGEAEEKADTYDEVNVSANDFNKNNKSSWLEIVRKLQPGDVSAPFFNRDNNKYVLLRLIETRHVGPDVFEEKRKIMTEMINKDKRNRLTSDLIEKLKKKYKVQVNRELFDSIKLDAEYQKDFLDQKLVSMTDFEATVNDLIVNATREKKLRVDLSDEVVKDIVLNSIISQTLVNKESLARGYEKRPPLMATYEFYKQNRLRAEVEAGLLNSVVISDQEVQSHYDMNVASYNVPEKYLYALLVGSEDVLKKVWVGTLQGADFNDLASKYSLSIVNQSSEIDALPPVILEELKKLEKGAVSIPFRLNQNYGLVRLLDRIPGVVLPLSQVKGKVVEEIKKDRFEMLKVEYINKLKSRSQIDINEGVWNDLARELGNEKKH